MGKVIEVTETLWAGLSDAAKRARRTPENLVRGLIREYLEVDADQRQDEALRKAARSSGYAEPGAVRLVREYRNRERREAAGKVSDASAGYRRPRSR
jgi:hypothetical protein